MLAAVAFVAASCKGGAAKGGASTENKTENVMKPINLTKAEFLAKVYNFEQSPSEWRYEGDLPAIIDFYADWCGPCKSIAPILDDIAAEYAGKIVVYKIDTDKEQELARVFGIRSIPTLLFIPKDGEPQLAQGAMPRNSFDEIIKNVLLKQ